MIYISICFNIFVICYIGEILTEQCRKIGEVVYMTDWYYLPSKIILDLSLIIARSNVLVRITAGKFVDMSVHTFGDKNLLKKRRIKCRTDIKSMNFNFHIHA
ncbi:hypothetical protein E2986_11717 [Frieseomelitta varia]|uniref:Uncharacterized protein n=1 Tax=Frieseomelitta varia TaxID=561572 RepID=A0A833SCR5_9HYME|nr:hypothetical protein E2986_11717 [Frieseomelitta varia]